MADSLKKQPWMDTMDTSRLAAFSGYVTDPEALKRSASGGAATAISAYFVQNGGVVFGVCYTDDFKDAVYGCAETVEALEQFRTSKYIAVQKKILRNGNWVNVFEEAARMLAEGRRVLFIGLGCDIGALLAYLKKQQVQTDLLYTIDLICHGPTYPNVQKAYVEELEKRFQSKVCAFSVRYKKKGWVPPFIRVEFENGKVFEERFYESDFGYGFKAYSRSTCYQCKFKGDNHVADLTLGDYWGCKPGMDAYNPQGVSLLLSRSEKGMDLVHAIEESGGFLLKPADMQLALARNPYIYAPRKKNPEQHEAFAKDLKENGLHYAVRHSSGYKAHRNRKIKRVLEDILPKSLFKKIMTLRSK